MLELGIYHDLEILRSTSVGLFLGKDDEEVLLPNKYVPEQFEIGDSIKVFVYLDSLERVVSTTLIPLITLNSCAYLEVAHLTDDGAFLEIGLEKQLMVPFREMISKMRVNQSYVVYCYLDKLTNRLIASTKVNKFLSNQELTVQKFEEVDLLVSHISDIGVNVIVNNKHRGLIYHDDLYVPLSIGDRCKGIVKLIRAENKLDISLHNLSYKTIEPNANLIMEHIRMNNNFLNLNDHSPPEEIHRILKMSKKNFKKAVGSLYKNKLIEIKENGIQLISK